ncbi:MAG: serine acetyltransferase [Geothrix sp.]|uniref:serine O-acetyltransferase n=1 Tax=Geothrix sp. TaxID=1962974 RepID=UPI00185050DB|nr:DapH/DapD/GlmU-related protein [Geothrix sp.]NWJ41648.1 serine acetyltransferase [Geothrix sp.]WIL20369.1 MAG: hypothetical protein QOZ81_002934 [Geothrix sp.]
MSLFPNLRADVARQHHFAGRQIPPEAVSLGQVAAALFSPRFAPVALFRTAYWCGQHHLRPLGKLVSMVNMVLFGLEIGLDCEIGPGLFFPHTSGTVLGARRIGRNAVIYHNVTVGAKFPDLTFDRTVRPDIGDDVFLGAGAKVLGSITLQDRVVVAANCVVVHDVPADSLVAGVPGRLVPKGQPGDATPLDDQVGCPDGNRPGQSGT